MHWPGKEREEEGTKENEGTREGGGGQEEEIADSKNSDQMKEVMNKMAPGRNNLKTSSHARKKITSLSIELARVDNVTVIRNQHIQY